MTLPSIPRPRTSILIAFSASVLLGLIVLVAGTNRQAAETEPQVWDQTDTDSMTPVAWNSPPYPVYGPLPFPNIVSISGALTPTGNDRAFIHIQSPVELHSFKGGRRNDTINTSLADSA